MFNLSVFDEKWAVMNTIHEIKNRITEAQVDIPIWDYEKLEYVAPGQYNLLERGTIQWGDRWDENYTYFFTKQLKPTSAMYDKNLYLVLDICGESEVYVNGEAIGSIDMEHSDVRISSKVLHNELFNIKIQSTKHAHDYVRSYRSTGKHYNHHIFNSAKLISKNSDVERFYYIAMVALEISIFEKDKELSDKVYNILKDVLCDVDYYADFGEFQKNIKSAYESLLSGIHALNVPFKYGKAIFMGHSHLDLAFKWSWKESVRKIERTLSNTCGILSNYPEGVFILTQVKMSEELKHRYPNLFNKIYNLIKSGRIELVGDIYIEFDTNIPSGESIIRQILYGKQFNKSNFNSESRVCYLPDTFGYAGIMPQILKQAGYEYFATTKLDWNDTNKPPYLFFNWWGIDGSCIESYLLHTGYGGGINFERISSGSSDSRQKNLTDIKIYQYGAGDGGGGISEDMMLTKNALKELDGFVEVMDRNLGDSLKYISAALPKLPDVQGELYFEKHRGVYTSQAAIKKMNRQSEITLRNAEFLSVLAMKKGMNYPKELLDAAWRKLLFNQFHDIIAGSCIPEAISDAVESFKDVIAEGKDVVNKSLSYIASNGEEIALFNTLSWPRNELIQVNINGNGLQIYDGQNILPYQFLKAEGDKTTILLQVRDIPPLGIKVLKVTDIPLVQNVTTEQICSNILENDRYKIQFDSFGEITSIMDKANCREVLRGKGNVLVGYLDRPGYFESWDIAKDFEKKTFPIQNVTEMRLVENGPLRWTMKITKTFRKSVITQYVQINNLNNNIDFKTEMDFFEQQILLKAYFDVDIDSPKATYDISMGSIQRATANDNSIEAAQFEVNTHKWADISQYNYGVSILNDCKYGCDIKNNRLRITLLKTSTFPDPGQDIGHHEFTYSLYPHIGDFREGRVTQAAYEFNIPTIIKNGVSELNQYSWLRLSGDNAVIETVKKSKDSQDIIVRLYECFGENSEVTLYFSEAIDSVRKCNVLEEELEKVCIRNDSITIPLRTFEIVTLKITFRE